MLRWKPFVEGYVKLNINGSYKARMQQAGVSGVLRDSHGKWIVGFTITLGLTICILVEIWGLFRGLKLAQVTNFQKWMLNWTLLLWFPGLLKVWLIIILTLAFCRIVKIFSSRKLIFPFPMSFLSIIASVTLWQMVLLIWATILILAFIYWKLSLKILKGFELLTNNLSI